MEQPISGPDQYSRRTRPHGTPAANNRAFNPTRASPAAARPAGLVQRALAAPGWLSARDALQLQRLVGNRAVGRLAQAASRPVIQAKLTVGPAHDAYEQEADRVASQLMSAPAPSQVIAQRSGQEDELQAQPLAQPITPLVRRQAAPEEEELQAKALHSAGGFEADANFEAQLGAARSGGQPLPHPTRAFMEQRMGADFSGVQVHTDARADRLNRSIQANAFTTGRNVFFRAGAFQPASSSGKALIAHELTHVVQQTGPGSAAPGARAQRNAKLDELDKRANEKRLAYAREDYVFDKSLQGSEEVNQQTLAEIDQWKAQVKHENDVAKFPPVFWRVYKTNPKLAIAQFGLTKKQEATANAILAGKVGGMNNVGAYFAKDDDPNKQARYAAKDKITKPEELFSPQEMEAHLGRFAKGAHAFIDVDTSKKIEGEIENRNFGGWGIDANFVAPLDEANALNAKAHKEKGIVTLEDELGIDNNNWSRTAWNPGKQLVRWVIPKPKLKVQDAQTGGVLLKMATGKETGAIPDAWVAGGLTKGGAHEARIDAIPRKDLVTMLAKGEIKQKIESYPETPDNIK